MINTQNYTRKIRVEEKRNIRNALLLVFFTVVAILLFALYGFGALARIAVFFADLKKGGQPVASEDTTPPIQPRFEPIPKATNADEIEVNGSTEPGSTVVLTIDNNDYEILANSNGEFRITTRLSDGQNRIQAYSMDNSGNKSPLTETHIITLDKISPTLEITKPLNGNSYYGSKQRQLVIEGKTDPDSQVNINGRHVVVDSVGIFTFLTTLSEGSNTFNVKAIDVAGNITEKSVSVEFFQ